MLMVFKHTKKTRNWLSLAVTVGVVAALAAAAWVKRDQLRASLAVVQTVPGWTLGLLAALFFGTMALAALAYFYLVLKHVRYLELLLVELAAAGVNRLVPSGVGSMGVHGLFLHRRGHSAAGLTAVIGTNNALGIVTHLIMLAVFGLFWHSSLQRLIVKLPINWAVLAGVAFGVALVLYLMPAVRVRMGRFVRELGGHFAVYKRLPHKPLLAALASTGITIVNVSTFGLAAYAVGIVIDPMTLFFVYSAGVLVGTATPTPGGLGGVEAGLIAGLMAYGATSTLALAAALTFRLATYWLPIIIGLPAFVLARKQSLI